MGFKFTAALKPSQNGCHSRVLPENVGRSSLGKRTALDRCCWRNYNSSGFVRESETFCQSADPCGFVCVSCRCMDSVKSLWVFLRGSDAQVVGKDSISVSEDDREGDRLFDEGDDGGDCRVGASSFSTWRFACVIVEETWNCRSSDSSILTSRSS